MCVCVCVCVCVLGVSFSGCGFLILLLAVLHPSSPHSLIYIHTHLRNIKIIPLGAPQNHRHNVIGIVDRISGHLAHPLREGVQQRVHVHLEGTEDGLSGLWLEAPLLGIFHDATDFALGHLCVCVCVCV